MGPKTIMRIRSLIALIAMCLAHPRAAGWKRVVQGQPSKLQDKIRRLCPAVCQMGQWKWL